MPGIIDQEDQIVDGSAGNVAGAKLMSLGDECHWDDIHWNAPVQEIELEDLQCCSLLVTDLMAEDQAMKSTVQI